MKEERGLIRSVRALSRFSLTLLLLVAMIIGALLSYLWVAGYYVSLGIRVPETVTITITNATFPTQDTTFFNVTLLTPSFSPSETKVTQIAALTEDGVLHNVAKVDPPLPHQLPKSVSQTFKCLWNWANYTGENIKIIAFIAEGSGATFQAKTPLVKLTITDVRFNSTISLTQFNMTVRSSKLSETYINITKITVNMETLKNVTPSLPYALRPNASVAFMCMWNWTNYRGKNATIAVHTRQGYAAYHTQAIPPPPVVLTITKVLFNTADTTHFNVTVQNSELSPTYVNITRITIAMENGTVREITEVYPRITPHYTLHPNSSATFRCMWNWTGYRNKNVTVTVYTQQEYVVSRTQTTPASPSGSSLYSISATPPNAVLSTRRKRFSFTPSNQVVGQRGKPSNSTRVF